MGAPDYRPIMAQTGMMCQVHNRGRVENRRSGFSLPVAVGLGFRCARRNPVWPDSVSCSRSSNRTGGVTASGSRKRHTMLRVTPSATPEHNSGWLDG